jgi:hypothetical protein
LSEEKALNVFLELLFGLWLGRATRGAKPLVVFTGFILVFVGIALMIAIAFEAVIAKHVCREAWDYATTKSECLARK